MIPADQTFAARHPRAAKDEPHRIDLEGKHDHALPLGVAGHNAQALYVSVRLGTGERVATTYVAKADGSGYEPLGVLALKLGENFYQQPAWVPWIEQLRQGKINLIQAIEGATTP